MPLECELCEDQRVMRYSSGRVLCRRCWDTVYATEVFEACRRWDQEHGDTWYEERLAMGQPSGE